jgi:hypothetical protein
MSSYKKIALFKKLAPRDLSVIQTREYVTVSCPSRPFGIVLGYTLGGDSLTSLKDNFNEIKRADHNVNFFTNLIVVLGEGLIWSERVNLSIGEKYMLLDTDEFANLVVAEQQKASLNQQNDEIIIRPLNWVC